MAPSQNNILSVNYVPEYAEINLDALRQCNVRHLEIVTEPRAPESWPINCFVMPNKQRLIYVEVRRRKKKVYIFDSYGGQTSDADKLFQGWRIIHVFHDVSFHNYESEKIPRETFMSSYQHLRAGALLSIIFSLHLRALAPIYKLNGALAAVLNESFREEVINGLYPYAKLFQLQPLSNRCCREFGFHGLWESYSCDTLQCMKKK